MDVHAIIRANPSLIDVNLIQPGQTISLPVEGADQSYTIRPGDTLAAIALQHHVEVATLARDNGINHPDHIRAGRMLHFESKPSASGAPTPSPVTQAASLQRPSDGSGALPRLTRPASHPSAPSAHDSLKPAQHSTAPFAGAQTFTLKSLAAAKAPHKQKHDFQQKMIDDVLPAARAAKSEYGVPVSVTLVQAAVESHWGQDLKGGAFFGVKAPEHPPAGMRTITFMTHEEDKKTGRRYLVPQTFVAYGSRLCKNAIWLRRWMSRR